MENQVKKNLGGRPRKEEYRKTTLRYSRVEDTFESVLDEMKNKKDKDLVMAALEKLKKNKGELA